MRTKPAPCWRASFVPTLLPSTLAAAMGRASAHTTCPAGMNQASAATLVAKFRRLAAALACRKSQPRPRTRANTKKLPVPGPNTPS